MTAALRSLLAVLAVAAGARAAAAQGLEADSQVVVVTSATDAAGTGAFTLRNTGPASAVAAGITVEPGCNDAVQIASLAGFMLAPGEMRSIGFTCAARPASMQRCGYRVRSSGEAVLLALEAVCAYAGEASLVPRSTALDFAMVAVGASSPATLELDNTGPDAVDRLFIETTDLAGNFTVAAPCNPDARSCNAPILAVAPGGTARLAVACTPRTPGPHTAQLHITTAAGTRLATPIALTCTGAVASAPVLSASPSVIDVGAVELINATAATTVRIANAGTGTLRLLDVQVVDGGTGAATDWTATARTPCSGSVPPACLLGVDQSADIDLVFDPSAIGVRDATLLLHFRDTADRSTAIPLRAIGRGATLDLVGGHTTLDFGTLPLNTAAALTFQVANRGTRNLLAGMVSSTAGTPFTVVPGPTFTVATAAPTTVTVTCRPTAPAPVPFATRLTLTASDVVGAPIELTLRCAGDARTALRATPPAILLGEVRTGTSAVAPVEISSASAEEIPLMSTTLEAANPVLSLAGFRPSTPTTLEVTAMPRVDASLADRILVTPGAGLPVLAIAVSGTAVFANYSAPPTLSLGAFCVDQPTTPRILELKSTGTASIAISAPVLQQTDSPFDLQLIAPVAYPTTLAAGQRALIAITPKRRSAAGLASDEVLWTTDFGPAAHTQLSASFVDDGPAIAPRSIMFGDTPIHLDVAKPREVTLQNCDVSLLQLEPPQISAPFSIDSPNFPTALQPGETTTFSVGFHPTKIGPVLGSLVITSPQLRDTPLVVDLSGTATATGGGTDAGVSSGDIERTSFYACSSCATGDTSGALVAAAAALALRRRRRRR